MSVLVTGGAGFIGSHFIERLLRTTDLPLVCLDNFSDYYDPSIKRANVESFAGHSRVTMCEDSFCDSAALGRIFSKFVPKLVVHLGALAGVHPSVLAPLDYEHTNIRGTLMLLEAAKSVALDRFVFASSSTVYGNSTPTPFAEDNRVGAPQSPYGATKLAAETLCLTYNALHGTPTVCVRPFSVYGARVRPDLAISRFAKAILRGDAIRLFGDGSVRRDFTHVSDICAGIEAAMFADHVVGECINLGNDHPVSVAQVIQMLEERIGKQAIIERCAANPADADVTCASTEKARRLIKYSPVVPFDFGLTDCVSWIKANA